MSGSVSLNKFDALFKNNKKLKQARIATRKAEEDRLRTNRSLTGFMPRGLNWTRLIPGYVHGRRACNLAHENYDAGAFYRYS